MIDTHAHLDDPAFDVDRAEVMARARVAAMERARGEELAETLAANAVALGWG